jgi:ABC-type glycerol-3-phosphate transport system permease component
MRYFDKAFFKFTLGFLCIICISLLVMYFASNFKDNGEIQTAQPVFAP